LLEQYAWLTQVLRGPDKYFGLPGNGRAVSGFHRAISQEEMVECEPESVIRFQLFVLPFHRRRWR